MRPEHQTCVLATAQGKTKGASAFVGWAGQIDYGLKLASAQITCVGTHIRIVTCNMEIVSISKNLLIPKLLKWTEPKRFCL